MWLTGFDAPSCSTVYLDKPMRNHTLMQTIARANWVFPGKHSGMIVDYANVFASLEKGLAIYGAGKDGKNPVKDKQKLVADLRKAVDAATAFCATRQVILPAIEQLVAGSLQRLQKLADAVDALISPDPLRREFLGHERIVGTLYGAVKPDPAALEFSGRVATLTAIADAIRSKLNPNPADITEVLGDIGKLLDASITGVGMSAKPTPGLDLSKIDFNLKTAVSLATVAFCDRFATDFSGRRTGRPTQGLANTLVGNFKGRPPSCFSNILLKIRCHRSQEVNCSAAFTKPSKKELKPLSIWRIVWPCPCRGVIVTVVCPA